MLVVDLVGEAPAAPAVFVLHGGATLVEQIGDALDRGVDHLVVELGVDDDHEFVRSHGEHLTSLRTRRAGAPRRAEQGRIWTREL